MLMRALCTVTALSLAPPAVAAPVDDLVELLRIEETIDIMRAEGAVYADELARDMLGGATPSWQAMVDRIYDADAMVASVTAGFVASIGEADVAPLVAFFGSELGQEIVALELGAREAMLDPDVEAGARARFRDLEGSEDAELALIERFVVANDLVEQNVTGALNASFAFYNGLADGGALEMTEAEMLNDIWSQEEATREDTVEWVHGYLLLAYGPLSNEELEAYVTLSETKAGAVLNQALFAGFNDMYNDISYALGLGAAREMAATDL